MWSIWFILFLLLPKEAQNNDLSCVNNYIKTISCEWNSNKWIPGQNCTLHTIRNTYTSTKRMNCSLNTSRSCSLNLSYEISFSTVIEIQVWCNQTMMDGVKHYKPGHHVKLHPPGPLKINRTVLMWSLGANFPEYIQEYIFQLQIKYKKQSWEDVKPIQVSSMSVALDNASMCVKVCEARIRIKPPEPESADQIRGTWSDWSPAVTWKTPVSVPPHSSHPRVIGIMVGIAVVILLFLTPLSIYRHKCGLKKSCEHVPDPSKYFQPLINEHKGNFQAWLGSQHSSSLFLPSQSFHCEISPVDEVSETWSSALPASTMLLYANRPATHTQAWTPLDTSQFSSGVSNMGYFYSEQEPGSVCLDSCPVYFTYKPPEGGSLQTSTSYERLQGAEPLSPDSGFGMEAEKDEDNYEGREDEEDAKTGNAPGECGGINMRHLVSFVLSLPETSKVTVPSCFAQLTPWHEEAGSPGTGANSESRDGPTSARPSSMVVQPCNSGYLTLKEMQKYSNKSI